MAKVPNQNLMSQAPLSHKPTQRLKSMKPKLTQRLPKLWPRKPRALPLQLLLNTVMPVR